MSIHSSTSRDELHGPTCGSISSLFLMATYLSPLAIAAARCLCARELLPLGRHSRRRLRIRFNITSRLVKVASRILQISSVERPSTSWRMKASRQSEIACQIS